MTKLFLAEPAPASPQKAHLGILLLNLGSPIAPEKKAVRRYLNQFLSDQRVVELPACQWQPLLKGIILPTRSGKSAQKYQKIWTEKGAPLLTYTRAQAQLLQDVLNDDTIIVDFAMTYGQPDIESVTQKLKAQGVSRLLVLPLFPQYAASSSGAALDALFRVLMKQRNMLAVTTISRFFDHPAYIRTIACNIQQHWAQNERAQHLLMSFHGVPLTHTTQGDPYFDECHHSARLIATALNLAESDYTVCFQSRFGKDKWTAPNTQALLSELPQQGIRTLDIVCPGFVADCLETLEEIAIVGKASFEAAGGTAYHYLPCPNAQSHWIDALHQIVQPFIQKNSFKHKKTQNNKI